MAHFKLKIRIIVGRVLASTENLILCILGHKKTQLCFFLLFSRFQFSNLAYNGSSASRHALPIYTANIASPALAKLTSILKKSNKRRTIAVELIAPVYYPVHAGRCGITSLLLS